MAEAEAIGFHKKFKLEASINTSNMVIELCMVVSAKAYPISRGGCAQIIECKLALPVSKLSNFIHRFLYGVVM